MSEKDEQLRAELAQVSAQLDGYAFRQDNKRIAAVLRGEEQLSRGERLSQEARERLEWRIIHNTIDATNADPEIERLIIREHELEMILRRRKDVDLYSIETTLEELPPEEKPSQRYLRGR